MSEVPAVRATVRYRLDPPPPAGQPPLTDAVGTVLINSPDEIVVATRRGEVRIPRHLVVATRIIPPRHTHRALAGGELSPLEMHRAAADGWPAMETSTLGEWVLRAARGFTSRANSVLPVGDPGLPLESALDAVEQWYAARHLPANVTLPGPVGFDPAGEPLGAALVARGYDVSDPTLFLIAATSTVRDALAREVADSVAAAQISVTTDIGEELTDAWLAAYDGYRVSDPVAARAIMTGSPAQRFITARHGDGIVGVGRLGVGNGWGGIAAMWVDPAYRRHGIARRMLYELGCAAAGLDVAHLHLQVWAHNVTALALYTSSGFRTHNTYVNITQRG